MFRARLAAIGVCALGLHAGCADTYSDSPPGDAGPGCAVTLSFSPGSAELGRGAVTVTASFSGELEGIRELSWSVTRDGESVPFNVVAVDDTQIAFTPTAAGVHTIAADATTGGLACRGDEEAFNVLAPGANSRLFRLRAVAAPGIAAPGERVLAIYGGADYHVGTLTLDGGLVASGTVQSASLETGPAYVRVTDDDSIGPLRIEVFAGTDGEYSMRVPPDGLYTRLIVPSFGQLPPVVELGLTAAELAGDVTIPAGSTFSGTVVDGAGQPIAGATVSVSAGAAPSVLAVTSASGTFSLRGRADSFGTIAIVPPADSGLPRLTAVATPLPAGGTINAAYAAGVAVRQHTFAVRLADGTTPAPGARIAFVGAIASAGTITVGGTAYPAAGAARIAVVAGGAGQVTSLRLADAAYDVVLEPASAGPVPALRAVDLTSGGAVGTLSFRAAGTVSGTVRDTLGSPIAGARIAATGRGSLANIASAATSVDAAANGTFSLPLAANGSYDLTITGPPAARVAPLTNVIAAPNPGQTTALGSQTLGATIEVSGEIEVVGAAPSAGGIQVLLYCESCSDADTPLAIAPAGPGGVFRLRAPDPGVDP